MPADLLSGFARGRPAALRAGRAFFAGVAPAAAGWRSALPDGGGVAGAAGASGAGGVPRLLALAGSMPSAEVSAIWGLVSAVVAGREETPGGVGGAPSLTEGGVMAWSSVDGRASGAVSSLRSLLTSSGRSLRSSWRTRLLSGLPSGLLSDSLAASLTGACGSSGEAPSVSGVLPPLRKRRKMPRPRGTRSTGGSSKIRILALPPEWVNQTPMLGRLRVRSQSFANWRRRQGKVAGFSRSSSETSPRRRLARPP